MSEMEDQIGAILGNPDMMQKIMSMAQSLGASASPPSPAPEPKPQESPSGFSIDPAAMQKIIGLAGQTGIDANQKALLHALRPYLTGDRIQKLEKAMRSAKLANLASTALGSGALSFLTGR